MSNTAQTALAELAALENATEFHARHIGPVAADQHAMLRVVGDASRQALMDTIVPESIRRPAAMDLPAPLSEAQALAELKAIAQQNQLKRNFIGQGYYGTHTPGVILRNILENPAWYTAYTPYQAEISQGRMEALVNFQTMVTDLTGMAIANASMLDEATAAAEAMTLAARGGKSKSTRFVVCHDVFPQTLEVIQTRAKPLGITVDVVHAAQLAQHLESNDCFAALMQFPGVNGQVRDLKPLIDALHAKGALAIASADLLALHCEVYDRCLPHVPQQPFAHSAPGHWTPHATLGRRFTADQVGQALAVLDGLSGDISARVVGLRRWDGGARVERMLIG